MFVDGIHAMGRGDVSKQAVVAGWAHEIEPPVSVPSKGGKVRRNSTAEP